MNERIIRASVDITNRFFSNENSRNDEIFKMFSGYLNNIDIKSNTGMSKMSLQFLPLNKKIKNTLVQMNNISNSNINFDFNNDENLILGFVPNAMSNPSKQNVILKGKKFKGIIKHGIDNYMFVDITLGNQKGNLYISDFNITNEIFKSPDAVSKWLPNNKIVEDAYTFGSDGIIRVQNHDYGNMADRFFKLNFSVNEGSIYANSELLTMAATATNQTSGANQIVDGTTAMAIQTFQPIKSDGANSSIISNHAYISGKHLNEVLVSDGTNGVNNDRFYKVNFDISNDRVTSIEEFSNISEKTENFYYQNFVKNPNLTKERVMDFVNEEYSKTRHLFTSSEIEKYNQTIINLKSKGKLNSGNAGVLADKIVTEQQIKTIKTYGYDSYLNSLLKYKKNVKMFENAGVSINDVDGIKTINESDYIKAFNAFYNSLESPTIKEIDVYNYVNNHLNKNVIAANILEGHLFDNFLDVAKQSANISGKVRYLSQAEFTPMGHMNTDLQRKAQAANRFNKLSLTTSEGKVFEPTEVIREILGNSVKEFSYKKTRFNYAQGEALSRLANERANIDMTSSLYKSQAKVLYFDSPLAFQDSNLFTNTFSLQNISMYDNKKPMQIKYASLTKNVFGDATEQEIQSFFEELQSKKYNFDALDDSKIKQNFLKNLLGKDAYTKYTTYRNAGNNVLTELKDSFSPLDNFKGSIKSNREGFIDASSQAVGNFNNWINKYALRSDGEASVNILNAAAVEAGQNLKISGSNYNIIESITFDKNGINLNLKHILLQGGGSKTMLDNVKATTQGLTDAIEVISDGYSHFVEGTINEKMTKGSRGFTGTFFARSLYTMASNALYADYSNEFFPQVQTIEDKFLLFKNTLEDTKFSFGSSGQKINIFDLLNVDLEYKNNTLYFHDRSVQTALDNRITKIVNGKKVVSAEEYLSGISLDARIKEAMNENLKRMYGRELSVEESKTLGSYASDLLYGAYDNLLKKMTKESALANRVRVKNPSVYKSYIAGNKKGMALVNELGDSIKNGTEWAYLFNADIYQMEETKKRAIEEGLRVGRLTGLTLSEIGFNDLVDVIKNKSVFEMSDVLKGYLMLSSARDPKFGRNTESFKNFFNETIDLADSTLVYNKAGMNVSAADYLANSPIGRLLKFNSAKGKLEAPTRGLIANFDVNYINELKEFFNSKHKFNDFNMLSGASVFRSELFLYENKAEFKGKEEIIKSLKNKSNALFSSLDLKKFFASKDIRDIINLDPESYSNDEKALQIYRKYKEQLFSQFNGNLTDEERNILGIFYKKSLEADSDAGFNFFKSFSSLYDTMERFSNEKGYGIMKTNFKEFLLDFNFNKNSLNSLVQFYSEIDSLKNRSVITSLFSDLTNIKGANMLANLSDLKEISEFSSIPFIIDSLSVDNLGKIVPNKTLNNLEKIIKTNLEIKDLYHIKHLLNYKNTLSKDEIFNINKSSKFYDKISGAFKNFITRHKEIGINKGYLNNSILGLLEETIIDGVNLNSIDNRSFYNLLIKNDNENSEIGLKLKNYIVNLKNNKNVSTLNSNFISLLRKSGISNNIISDVERQALNLFDEKYPNPKNFVEALSVWENQFKNSDVDEELYNNVHQLKNNVIDFLGESYRNIIAKDYLTLDNFVDQLNSSNFTSSKDAESFIKSIVNGIKKNDTLLKSRMKNLTYDDIDKQIYNKQRSLTNLLINRNYHLGESILSKGGIIYDSASTTISHSAAFSPREGSAITNFIRTEMREILQNRKFENGQVVISDEYDDFKKALKLIYGETLVDSELKDFNDLYFSPRKLNWKVIKDQTNEIKKKLDDYSHIIVGDRNMYTLNGQIGMFKGDSQVAYGIGSRHPHQYKGSVTPIRFVLLNEEDKALSFIGKYIGTGNIVDSTQSSLYTIGKKTALGAKGDFDGDIFQIMFLGDKEASYRTYKNMDSKRFLNLYKKKLELYNLLINSTSDDLQGVFYGNPELVYKNEKYKRMKSLVQELYFKKDYKITNQEVYDTIRRPYLSLVHENVRILKMLEDERLEHMNLPDVFGDIDLGNGKKLSKRSVTELLLTLPDEVRNRYLIGDYDRFSVKEVIRKNINLSKEVKKELNSFLKNENSKELIVKAMEYMKEDNNAVAWQMLHRHINKHRDDTGLFKTPFVHTKLTNFRNAVDAMSRKEFYGRAINYLEETQGKKGIKLFVDSGTLALATSAHDLGTLIEKLAISSKKGSVSPDLKLTQFIEGNRLIKENNIDFDYKTIAKMVGGMESYLAKNHSIDSVISSSFYRYIYGKDFNSKTQTEFLQMNFNEWFRSLYNNIEELSDDDYLKLKRAFLTLGDVSDIEKVLNNNSLTIRQIFSDKQLMNSTFSSLLSNWTEIMFKGQLERVMNITGDINTNLYKEIFGISNEGGFNAQFKKIWGIITSPIKKFGTRDEGNIFVDSATGILEEHIKKASDEANESIESTTNMADKTSNISDTIKKVERDGSVPNNVTYQKNKIENNNRINNPNINYNNANTDQEFVNEALDNSRNKLNNLYRQKMKLEESSAVVSPIELQIRVEDNIKNAIPKHSKLVKRTSKKRLRKTKAQKEFELMEQNKNSLHLNFSISNEPVKDAVNNISISYSNYNYEDIYANQFDESSNIYNYIGAGVKENNVHKSGKLKQVVPVSNSVQETIYDYEKIYSNQSDENYYNVIGSKIKDEYVHKQGNLKIIVSSSNGAAYNYENIYSTSVDENYYNVIGSSVKERTIHESGKLKYMEKAAEEAPQYIYENIPEYVGENITPAEYVPDEIEDIANNRQIEEASSEIKNEIKNLKKQLDEALEEIKIISKQKEDIINELKDKNAQEASQKVLLESKDKQLLDLNQKVAELKEQVRKLNGGQGKVLERIQKRASEITTNITKKAKTYTNSDLANAAKKQISNHKTGLAVAAGTVVLASFFRIFQKSRPVVNLDINEQEYEHSQGSLYRNLGQYTMNTNIRSLY